MVLQHPLGFRWKHCNEVVDLVSTDDADHPCDAATCEVWMLLCAAMLLNQVGKRQISLKNLRINARIYKYHQSEHGSV